MPNLTDDELRRLYDEGYLKGHAPGANTTDPQKAANAFHLAALRAVYEAGCRAQRDMEPTPEMIQAAEDRFVEGSEYIAENSIQFALWLETLKAVNRAAPLVSAQESAAE